MKELRTIASLPGYEDVRDLIPDGVFLHYTDVWRLSLEFYRDEFDELKRRMILEMVNDVQDRTADRVALIMESPDQISFPDSWQITGLAVEDIRDRGLEDVRWRVYDYETSGFSVYCRSIRLERRKNTEASASPTADPLPVMLPVRQMANMRQKRFVILVLWAVVICLVGFLALRLAQPSPATDVGLIPRGIQTNSSGTLCLLVAITNSSSTRTYGIGFATQTKAGGRWEAPSLIKHFNLIGTQTILPGSTTEVLVPVPQTSAPWRVAALCFEQDQIPSDPLGRFWRNVRFRLGHFRRFLTTPEISPTPSERG